MSFSPFLPSAPNTTPAVAASGRRAQRAPIYNPYDKFTAPEFDAWIGDITSALRRALGHETEEPEQDRPEVTSASASTERDASDPRDVAGTEAADTDEGSEEESFVVEDSFAHIASRRAKAKAKGKGRDPREGPGLGDGRRDQPIEILSDSGSQSDGSDEDEDEEVEESLNGDGRCATRNLTKKMMPKRTKKNLCSPHLVTDVSCRCLRLLIHGKVHAHTQRTSTPAVISQSSPRTV
ncbi:hypothetical protein FA95DRAFT_708482 [Auriscalpium vulgare]|uniref:Uncharacterized protein n=1 Tax=Auriscalpium vulgare TaxID=40419 RepID=A0ACB8RCF4_9AGAM|nr:hypothetical protein FA95DRAFT_708482 [Auriscalpium vulgare]